MFPKLVEFKAVKPEKVIVDGEEMEKTSYYKPRCLRWSGLKATEKKAPSRVVDFEGLRLPIVLLHPSRGCPTAFLIRVE